jgi:hypothetical protein
MSQSILTFDFGTNEEAAQQARVKIENWKQGFRLGNKMAVKFEREESAESGEESSTKASGAKKAAGKKAGNGKGEADSGVRVLLRLDFSDHEKLSHQRWLDRIPGEEPFKSAKGETVRTGDPEFPKLAELFESLD